jgi:hypothetical protein
VGLIGTMNRVVSIGVWYRQTVGHLQLGWGGQWEALVVPGSSGQ